MGVEHKGGAVMQTHILKTDPEAFEAVFMGVKTYELRFADRCFRVGDSLVLKETRYSGVSMKSWGAQLEYTGREYMTKIKHILRGPTYGLMEGWVILSI